MIRPPFTILILKNAHRPVTIRVTTLTLLLFLTVVPVFSCAAGIGLNSLFRQMTASQSIPSPTAGSVSGDDPSFVAPPVSAASDSIGTGISEVFTSRTAGGGMEVSFTPTNAPSGETCYIWVILNPDRDSGEMVIHPRSPVFRGMPVDYRNGIPFLSAREKKCAITVEDIPDGLSITRIRILMFSSAGRVLSDTQLAVGQQARM